MVHIFYTLDFSGLFPVQCEVMIYTSDLVPISENKSRGNTTPVVSEDNKDQYSFCLLPNPVTAEAPCE